MRSFCSISACCTLSPFPSPLLGRKQGCISGNKLPCNRIQRHTQRMSAVTSLIRTPGLQHLTTWAKTSCTSMLGAWQHGERAACNCCTHRGGNEGKPGKRPLWVCPSCPVLLILPTTFRRGQHAEPLRKLSTALCSEISACKVRGTSHAITSCMGSGINPQLPPPLAWGVATMNRDLGLRRIRHINPEFELPAEPFALVQFEKV